MLKSYAFDLDQNIFYTKTPIHLLVKQPNGSRKEEPVPNADFEKKLQDKENVKLHDDIEVSMRDFRWYGKLIQDVFDVVYDEKWRWPIRNEFKKATIDADPTHIITARGNPVSDFLDMHKKIIYEVFTQAEKEEMAINMSNKSKHMPYQFDRLVSEYLKNNLYIPCSNPDLIKKLHRENISWYQRKALAFEKCIKKTIHNFAKYYGASFMKHKKISIWFSDDSKKNIDAIKDYINETLKFNYPEIVFYLYNTEDPSTITKEIIIWKSCSMPLF